MIATTRDGTRAVQRAYRQLFELGRGGMARVHLAESLSSGVRKLVVLKVLNPEFCASSELRAAFRREAELSAQMNHPNVVQVLEVVDYDDAPAMVMEYLEGVSLSQLLRETNGALPLPLRAYVLSQVLAGLHHFHELVDLDGTPLGAVHRDVSPQNVMVLHDGLVKVVDFGIAKVTSPNDEVTRAGVVKGKIHYMPPEQLLGEPNIDRRADLFAVGVMLWEAVAGRRLWKGKTETEVFRALASGEIPKLEGIERRVPDALLRVVARATAAERADRFATAQEMQSALDAALAKQGWLSQPRDLALFMATHFGAARREQESRVKDSLRALPVAPVPPAEEPGRTSNTAGPVTRSEPAVSGVVRAPARRWGWGVAAAACVAVAGWLVMTHRPAPAAPAAAPQRSVALEIEALPRGAEIFLDGQRIGTDRFSGKRPATSNKVVLEVRAEGFVTLRRELTLQHDLAMQLVLQPEPAAAATAPPSAAASAPSPSVEPQASDSVETRAGARKRGSVSSTPRASAKKKAKNCDPPYTFSADGIKIFKAECY